MGKNFCMENILQKKEVNTKAESEGIYHMG
jgi:hypothetical protein